MLKSSKLVLALALLLGGSCAVLPSRSFAATRIESVDAQVSATVTGYIAFSATAHTPGSSTTYDSTNNKYVGTFRPGDNTSNFGTTTFQVYCNYRTTAYGVSTPDYEDSDSDGDTDELITTTAYNGTDCGNGWSVSAASTTAASGAATMVGANHGYAIKSTPLATNPLTGATSNWVMQVAGVSKTVSGSTFAPAPANYTSGSGNYGSLSPVPAYGDAKTVITGATFRNISSTMTYIGPEEFTATYGFVAGLDAIADTYNGSVVYTLHVNAAS